MAAVVWKPTKAAVDAAILTATGSDIEIGTTISGALLAIGTAYDRLFVLSIVDPAKTLSASETSAVVTAWTTQATNAHDAADEGCRYLEDQVASAGAALVFDATTFPTPILQRLKDDIALADANSLPLSVTLLRTHRDTVNRAQSTRPIAGYFVPQAPYDGPIPSRLIAGGTTASKKRALQTMLDSITVAPKLDHVRVRKGSIREIELSLEDYISIASAWITMAAYV